MPAYIHLIHIDWHVSETPDLRGVLIDANARATGAEHTYDSVLRELTAVAKAHPGVIADALVDTGYNSFGLIQVRDGVVTQKPFVERPEDSEALVDLPYDDLAHIELVRDHDAIAKLLEEVDPDVDVHEPFDLGHQFANERQLRTIATALANAIDQEGGSFVAELDDGGRLLVEIAPKHVRIASLVVDTEPALFARLRDKLYEVPSRPKVAAKGAQFELELPGELLAFVEAQAKRTGRTVEFLVQYALKIATIERAQPITGPTQRRAMKFGAYIRELIETHAQRLGVSASVIVATALSLAKSELESF
ncbi:MAG TPA: hypothetical protein VGC41_11190 [Kofleriaceae bacterium]